MVKRALATAVAACLLAAPSASAAGHSLLLSDPHETACTTPPCTPDLASVSIFWDSGGAFYVSMTFYDALPAYTQLGATRVRVSLGRGLTADGAACTPVGGPTQLAGEAGDVRIEVGAYDGGTSTSSAANGVLYVVGAPGPLALTRIVSSDRKTLTVTTATPAPSDLDLRCAQADVADDSDASTSVVRDAAGRSWFIGFDPASASTPSEATASTATEETGVPSGVSRPRLTRPSLVTAPAVKGVRKVAALLTCKPGRWKHASRFSFRWLRDGRGIARASSARYRVRAADHQHRLRCSVKAVNADGSRLAASRPLRIR